MHAGMTGVIKKQVMKFSKQECVPKKATLLEN